MYWGRRCEADEIVVHARGGRHGRCRTAVSRNAIRSVIETPLFPPQPLRPRQLLQLTVSEHLNLGVGEGALHAIAVVAQSIVFPDIGDWIVIQSSPCVNEPILWAGVVAEVSELESKEIGLRREEGSQYLPFDRQRVEDGYTSVMAGGLEAAFFAACRARCAATSSLRRCCLLSLYIFCASFPRAITSERGQQQSGAPSSGRRRWKRPRQRKAQSHSRNHPEAEACREKARLARWHRTG